MKTKTTEQNVNRTRSRALPVGTAYYGVRFGTIRRRYLDDRAEGISRVLVVSGDLCELRRVARGLAQPGPHRDWFYLEGLRSGLLKVALVGMTIPDLAYPEEAEASFGVRFIPGDASCDVIQLPPYLLVQLRGEWAS